MWSFLSDQPLLGWLITALVTYIILKYYQGIPEKKKNGRELPPMAPITIREAAAGLFSFEAPSFFLKLARQMQQPVFRLPLPPTFYLCCDYETARIVLEDPLSTKWERGYRFFELVAGDKSTFFSREGTRFKHVRKATSPAFKPQHVEHMMECIELALKAWIDKVLEPAVSNNTPVDISEELQRVTVTAIGKVAFEYDLNETEREEVLSSLQTTYKEFAVRTPRNPLRDSTLLGWMYPEVREAREASRRLRRICAMMLKHYRANKTSGSPTASILSMIDSNTEYASDEERISDMIAYLAGGYDTASYTISWTLLELSRNPDIQIWLRDELRACKSTHEQRQCTALKHTIRESMRLHSTAALGSLRSTGRDINVPNTNYYIPKGALVDMPYYVIHRDERVFERADDFLPHRWETATDVQLKAFLGFAAGRRNCQGQSLANAELTVILAELCSKYEWNVVDEGHVEYYVTLKTVGTLLAAKKAE